MTHLRSILDTEEGYIHAMEAQILRAPRIPKRMN
jgi:hypothetical protein